MNTNPWLGLKSYEENDQLYGRQKESDELANIVINSFHTIIYGKSGIGKTSLLRAGVFPTLRYEDFMPIYIRLEHKENAEEDYYLRQIEEFVGKTHGCESLNAIFSSCTFAKSRGIEQMPVFVFDQFEEIFTLNENRESEAVSRFFADLSDILNDSSDRYNFRIVICLREDYLYYIESLSESIPAFKRNRYRLQNLTRDEALEVITQPCKGMVDDAVAQEILHKLSPKRTNEVNATILSLYMSQLYDKMVKSGDKVISSSLIRQFGDDIISAFYFESIAGVSERSIEYLEDHLITTGGYRHNVPMEDAVAAGVKQNELDRLKDRRIITIQPRQGSVLYMEYAHDVLCPIIVGNRDKRTLRKKAKRQKKIIAAWILSILFMAGITTSFILQNRQISKKQESMLLMQSRAIAGQAEQLLQNGEYAKAIALCVKALPEDLDNPDRPISYEALSTLASLYYSDFYNCKTVIRDGECINCATFSPDSKCLVTTSEEGNVKMWNLASGKLVRVCKGHTGKVFEAFYSPDGKCFATCSEDSTVRIWDAATGKCLRVLKGHRASVSYSVFSPDGRKIATTSDDSTARIWDAATGKCLRILKGHKGNVYNPSFSPDGRSVATTSQDSTIRIWDVQTGKQIKMFRDDVWVPAVAFSCDGKYLAVSNKCSIKILNTTNYEQIKELMQPDSTFFEIDNIEFSPDGQYVCGAALSLSFIWRISTGKLTYCSDFPEGTTSHSNIFCSDSKHIILVSDSTVIIRNFLTGEQEKTLNGQGGIIGVTRLSQDGRFGVTLDNYGKSMFIFDLSRDKQVNSKKLNHSILFSKIINHCGDFLCAKQIPDSIAIYNITKDKIVKKFYNGNKKFHTSLSPNLRYVIPFDENDTTLEVWNTEEGKVVSVINGYKGRLVDIVFSPDNRYVATVSRDSVVILWNVLTGKKVRMLTGHKDWVNSAVFSPDMQYITTVSTDSTARIWNLTNGKLVRTLKGHTGEVNYAAYSQDGKYIVTASSDTTLRMWNALTGKLIKIFRGHDAPVTMAAFSPDCKYLVSATKVSSIYKNNIRIWDVTIGKTIQILDHFEATFVSFSNDGRKVIAFSEFMSTMKVWNFIEPQELIDHFRSVVGDYQFTPEEEIKYYLK